MTIILFNVFSTLIMTKNRIRSNRKLFQSNVQLSFHSTTGTPSLNWIGNHIYRASLVGCWLQMSPIKIKQSFRPSTFRIYVLWPPKVISLFGPTQGLGCCVHGPQMDGAENIRASLGAQPVQPEVIIQYIPSFLKIAGASFCPAGATRTYFPVCER